jgi:uncharacterized protein (DUF2236 family)
LLTADTVITMLSETHELLSSVSMGDVARVQQLLDSGVSFDAASPGVLIALHAACMTGKQEVLELLLQRLQQQRQQHQGSSSTSLEPHLPRCVAAAASMGHVGIIRSILAELTRSRWTCSCGSRCIMQLQQDVAV